MFFYRKELKLGFEQIYRFLEGRIPPRNRENIDEILAAYGMTSYNVYELCRRSHGTEVNDSVWLKYPEDKLMWKDVLAWKS